jgi:hypothetical protein
MAFLDTWDEAKPSGSRDTSLGDDDIREFKRGIRERLAIDHEAVADEAGNVNVGYHKKATLLDSVSNQAAVTGCGVLFTKTVGTVVELFYIDSAGSVIQLTTGGVLRDSVSAKTGDWLTSSVTTARTGWTNVSATYSDKFMRVNATPLTTGGANTVTLTTTELPAHTHTGPAHTHTMTGGESGSGDSNAVNAQTDGQDVVTTKTTSSSGTGNTGSAGSGAAFSIVPAFVQVVLFQKD